MGWLVLGLRPAGVRGARSDSKEVWEHPKSECPSRTSQAEVRPKTEVRTPMKVLIGVDPHKTSVAVAAVATTKGDHLGWGSFPHSPPPMTALTGWRYRFSERRRAWGRSAG